MTRGMVGELARLVIADPMAVAFLFLELMTIRKAA